MGELETDVGQTETNGTSRRALLKGAVGVGVGVAVYSTPIVSVVPAYATHGIVSHNFVSDSFCISFSPNHGKGGFPSKTGDWHDENDSEDQDANVIGEVGSFPSEQDTSTSLAFTFSVPVNGTQRFFEWGAEPGGSTMQGEARGNPNNSAWDDVAAYTNNGWDGGGVRIKLLDPNCEMEIQALGCNYKCKDSFTGAAPWGEGSSTEAIFDSGDAGGGSPPNGNVGVTNSGLTFLPGGTTAYYHSGRRDHDDGKDKRCKMAFKFRVNCVV